MKNDEKNIHEGHRERLLEMVAKIGLENMTEVQAVEFMLTYIMPRGDVNPLAHRLLNEFENFTQIVDADESDLKRIKGINDRSAKKISMLKEMFFFYSTSKMRKPFQIKTKMELLDVLEDILRFRTTEHLLLLALSPANIVTYKRLINVNSVSTVGLDMLELTDFLSSSKPASLVVAHCHPYGSAKPSVEDGKAFEKIENLCKNCGVKFLDSYIVGEDGVYSQRDEEFSRTFYDVDQLR